MGARLACVMSLGLLLSILAVGGRPGLSVSSAAGGGPLAFIPNWFDNNVSVIDTSTNTLVGSPIPVGSHPRGVAVNAAGSRVYITNVADDTLSVIDTSRIGTSNNPVIGTVQLGQGSFLVHGVAVNPAGTRVYVTKVNATAPNTSPGEVWVIDAASNTPIGSPILVGNDPVGVAVNPAGTRVYVTNTVDATVSVINASTNAVIGSPISTGPTPFTSPEGIVVSPNGAKVYVENGSGSVSVIDTATNTVSSPISLGATGGGGIAVSPAGTRVYVTTAAGVAVIDATSNSVIGSPIPVGQSAEGMALTPDGARLYVADWQNNIVSVINTSTNAVTGSPIAVGNRPFAFGQFIQPGPATTPPTPVATKLAFTTQPPTATAVHQPFGVTVAVEDANGGTVTTDNTTKVRLQATGGSGKLKCNADTVTASQGSAAFVNCSFTDAGTYNVQATADKLSPTPSTQVVVGQPALHYLALGDSIAAGEDLCSNATDPCGSGLSCQTSLGCTAAPSFSYPADLAKGQELIRGGTTLLTNYACSGVTTDAFINGETPSGTHCGVTGKSEYQTLHDDGPTADLITITIGADDYLNFAAANLNCLLFDWRHPGRDGNKQEAKSCADKYNTLRQHVQKNLLFIYSAAQNTGKPVYVTGYYSPLSCALTACDNINASLKDLNEDIHSAVSTGGWANLHFVATAEIFAHHQFDLANPSDPNSYIVIWKGCGALCAATGFQVGVHPSVTGQSCIADKILESLPRSLGGGKHINCAS